MLGYIKSLGGSHATAAQIAEHLGRANVPIGRTTVYRHLEKLTESGELRRFAPDGMNGSCYQYADGAENCLEHLHLKCEGCGELLHHECDELAILRRHVLDEHSFKVDALRTVLYGRCEKCADGVK